jgi:hypothetical protein
VSLIRSTPPYLKSLSEGSKLEISFQARLLPMARVVPSDGCYFQKREVLIFDPFCGDGGILLGPTNAGVGALLQLA